MKKNKIIPPAPLLKGSQYSAFTLIELIVVSMIIVLLSASSMFYFFDFLDQRELFIHTDIFSSEIESLDDQVKNFEISDYSLSFSGWASYYIWNKNILWVDDPVSMNLDSNMSATFEIATGSWTQAWNYSIYEDSKLVSHKIVPADIDQTYEFTVGKSYEIQSYLSGATLNTLFVWYMFPADSWIEFIWNTGEFHNKNNIKNEFDLTFEKSGKSHTITLK